MRFRGVLLALVCALSGCVSGPEAPKGNVPSAYAWRAPLAIGGSEPIYRFDLPQEIDGWMRGEKIGSIAVFDAAGKPMTCGSLDAMSLALSWMETTYEGRVSDFDAATCASTDRPHLCFAGAECRVEPGCPEATVDLGGTPPQGIATLDDLLAIANAPDCDADPVAAACRSATPAPALSRTDARAALARAGLGRFLTADTPRVAHAGNGPSGAMGGALLTSRGGALSGRGQLNPSNPPRNDPMLRKEAIADSAIAGGGYVVEFERPVTGFDIEWHADAGKGIDGRTTTIVYDAGGRARTRTEPMPRTAAPRFTQHVATEVPARSIRVVFDGTASGLTLARASRTDRATKPFADGERRQFWFETNGTPPYGIYFAPHLGMCGASGNTPELLALPHIHDADFPPPANVGAREPNPRSLLTRLAADDLGKLAWLYWLAGMLGLWLAGAVLVGARALLVRAQRHRA